MFSSHHSRRRLAVELGAPKRKVAGSLPLLREEAEHNHPRPPPPAGVGRKLSLCVREAARSEAKVEITCYLYSSEDQYTVPRYNVRWSTAVFSFQYSNG